MSEEHQASQGTELVIERRQFYSDGFHRMVMMSIFLLVTNIIAIAFMLYIIGHPPAPRYFQVDERNQIISDPPLNVPMATESEVKTWARTAAQAFYTFDYVNYRGQFDNLSLLFTQQGWSNYKERMKASQLLNNVQKNNYIVTATSNGGVTVMKKMVINGRYTWAVKVPLVYQFVKPGMNTINNNVEVTFVIQRVPRTESPYGLAVNQVIVV